MPDPLIAHVIGTVALLGTALLIVASFAIIQQVNYVQALSLMLSEAAESCAREIVELVSIHTLGGGEYTYMILTLPQSLGGQPYNLTLENVEENVIAVKAQLQLYRQVRIVVTPNFGRAPVYAVPTTMRFGEFIVSPTILLPTPYGWKAALVAARSGDAILIGFTTQPPTPSPSIGPPNFIFINWSLKLEGLTGSKQEFIFAIWNKGGDGTATVVVFDSAGWYVNSTTLFVEGGTVKWGKMTLPLPSERGSYAWRVECQYGGYTHDSRTFLVVSESPHIVIRSHSSSISGAPQSRAVLSLELANIGGYDGTAEISIDGKHLGIYKLPAGAQLNLSFNVELPSTLGSFVWTLSVRTLETGYVDQRQLLVFVRSPLSPYISWVNSTIDGLTNWNAKVCVRITNPSESFYEVDLLLNGTLRAAGIRVPPGASVWINFTGTLPSQRGYYRWNLSLVSSNLLLDTKIINLVVRAFDKLERTAILYSTFDSTSLGRWTNEGGQWSVSGGVLRGKDQSNPSKQDGFCSLKQQGKGNWQVDRCGVVYYWLEDISSYIASPSGLAILVNTYVDENDRDVYKGFALLAGSRDQLYGVTLYRASDRSAQLQVELFSNGEWRFLDSSASAGGLRGWYTLFLRSTYSGISLEFTYELYDMSSSLLVTKSRSLAGFLPNYVGLLVSKGSGEFDNIVIALGDPRYIVLRGLPPGWKGELYSGTRRIAEGVSRGDAGVLLPVMGTPIITNARIVVKDPYGEVRLELAYPVLVGGDIFVFSP